MSKSQHNICWFFNCIPRKLRKDPSSKSNLELGFFNFLKLHLFCNFKKLKKIRVSDPINGIKKTYIILTFSHLDGRLAHLRCALIKATARCCYELCCQSLFDFVTAWSSSSQWLTFYPFLPVSSSSVVIDQGGSWIHVPSGTWVFLSFQLMQLEKTKRNRTYIMLLWQVCRLR